MKRGPRTAIFILTPFLLCFLLLILAGCILLHRLYPMAEPLELPAAQNVVSINISTDTAPAYLLSPDDHAALLDALSAIRPTRGMTLNDYPDVRPYHCIEINTSSGLYRLFLYEYAARTYVESPYEGIYRADDKLYELISP